MKVDMINLSCTISFVLAVHISQVELQCDLHEYSCFLFLSDSPLHPAPVVEKYTWSSLYTTTVMSIFLLVIFY